MTRGTPRMKFILNGPIWISSLSPRRTSSIGLPLTMTMSPFGVTLIRRKPDSSRKIIAIFRGTNQPLILMSASSHLPKTNTDFSRNTFFLPLASCTTR